MLKIRLRNDDTKMKITKDFTIFARMEYGLKLKHLIAVHSLSFTVAFVTVSFPESSFLTILLLL